MPGRFITFEGIDGCGKTTQADRLKKELEGSGSVVILARDPGSSHIGEAIRSVLLDRANRDMTAEAELLLYEAARAQLVGEVIRPALDRGAWVIGDRFSDSTVAYQQYGRGIDAALVEEANRLGTLGVLPELTLVLDVGVATADARRSGREPDRLESSGDSFMERVAEGYRALAREDPERVALVDGSGPEEEVWERIRGILVERGILHA